MVLSDKIIKGRYNDSWDHILVNDLRKELLEIRERFEELLHPSIDPDGRWFEEVLGEELI